jgi:molybdopterin molybdotransferase
MITSQKALQIILDNTEDFGIEEIPFLDSLGRILKEDIIADREFPPFNRVSMDGIAISYHTFSKGAREFAIENIQPAGSAQVELIDSKNCIEVMTGAVLPKNVDVVIPYEQVIIENGIATVQIDEIKPLQNVHLKGKDRIENDILQKKDTIISSAEIGIFATVGKSIVKVAKQPKVLIISTGDELVGVSEKPLSYQIRRSNVYTLVSLLERLQIKAETEHISDNKQLLKQKIERHLEHYDVLLFSGAVSKGKFDFLPEVFDELGVEKLFHKVKQRPGKPFWFGKRDSKNIFAFPGNPVSTFVGCLKYFYPWYKKSMGIDCENHHKAILAEDFVFKPELTYFLQVITENKNGMLYATPFVGNGSGDLANLAETDAFIELPDHRNEFNEGEVFPLIEFR